jgi:hypothetical protein
MQVLMQRVSRRSRRKPRRRASSQQLRLLFRDSLEPLPRFWQYRFYDFNVWSQTKFAGGPACEAGLNFRVAHPSRPL